MNLTSADFPTLLELCMKLFLSEQYSECSEIARHVLELSPQEEAFQAIMRACDERQRIHGPPIAGMQQSDREAWGIVGKMFLKQGDVEGAKRFFQQAIVSNPTNLDSYQQLAELYTQSSQFDEAAKTYLVMVAREPDSLVALEGLIACYIQLGRKREALELIERCMPLVRDSGAGLKRLADVLKSIAEHQPAKHLYIAALEKVEGSEREDLFVALGEIESKEKHYSESESWFWCALEVSPESYPAQRGLITLHLDQGNFKTAKRLVTRFFETNPKSLSLFFLKTTLELEPAYESIEQIAAGGEAFVAGLEVIRQALPTVPERVVNDFEFLFDNLNVFYLPYRGESVVALQRMLGAISESAMQRLISLPALDAHPTKATDNKKIRVGIVSGFFRDHSNYKIPVKGWIKELDRNTFETFGYHVCSRIDQKTHEAASYFDHFVQGPRRLREWIEAIRADALDVLIYPEIGMEPACRKLACFRLAPVQVNSWGHPVTSGLSTIDYFLSSDLMEGPDSDKEYTEKLVRLPKLSINYEPPARTRLALTRADIGLREDTVAYWCCQVVYKYLPQFDWVYAEIAARVPNSQFVFITIQPSSETALIFKTRMTKAFQDRGLSPENHLIFLAGLSGDEFATVASLCDLSLDTFGWSGCNSALETLAQGVPVITFPGEFMRGRHAEAILKVIGCEELIAASPEAFIQLAVSLGSDPVQRLAISAKVQQGFSLACNDTSCVRKLEEYLKEWAGR